MFNNQNKAWQDYQRENERRNRRRNLPGVISGMLWLPFVAMFFIGG